jgi:hypothetical protein
VGAVEDESTLLMQPVPPGFPGGKAKAVVPDLVRPQTRRA